MPAGNKETRTNHAHEHEHRRTRNAHEHELYRARNAQEHELRRATHHVTHHATRHANNHENYMANAEQKDQTAQRLKSLDAFRGFDMMFIMGFEALFTCLTGISIDHVPWHGLAFMDTVFPTFLFIAGISFPFSWAKRQANGTSKAKMHLVILKRMLILIFLGLLYNGLLKRGFHDIRYASVLARIGIAWAISAALFINLKARWRAVIAAIILIGYWLLLRFVQAPDAAAAAAQASERVAPLINPSDPFSITNNIASYIDRQILPGRMYLGIHDPEGIFSTIPAIVTAMLGMFTGEFVRSDKYSGNRKAIYMAIAAAIMLALGLIWSTFFPINKNLWTSSFVLVVGAYSLGMFALFYWIIDVKGWSKWTKFFTVIGMNSITIYMLQAIVNFSSISRFFLGSFAELLPETLGEALLDVGYIAACWFVLWFLDKKHVYLKV